MARFGNFYGARSGRDGAFAEVRGGLQSQHENLGGSSRPRGILCRSDGDRLEDLPLLQRFGLSRVPLLGVEAFPVLPELRSFVSVAVLPACPRLFLREGSLGDLGFESPAPSWLSSGPQREFRTRARRGPTPETANLPWAIEIEGGPYKKMEVQAPPETRH